MHRIWLLVALLLIGCGTETLSTRAKPTTHPPTMAAAATVPTASPTVIPTIAVPVAPMIVPPTSVVARPPTPAAATLTPIPPTVAMKPTPVPATVVARPPTPAAATLTPIPPTLAMKPTPVPATMPMAAVPAYPSGGLGLSRAEWEKAHGMGFGNPVRYENDKFLVVYIMGNVFDVIYQFRGSGMPINTAVTLSKAYIPADAMFVRTYTDTLGNRNDVYLSSSLTARFTADANNYPWNAGKPGSFTIVYDQGQGGVAGIELGIGDNPG